MFKVIIHERGHTFINGETGHSSRVPYDHPAFVDGYMYLSEYWSPRDGVYKIEKVAGSDKIEFEDRSMESYVDPFKKE